MPAKDTTNLKPEAPARLPPPPDARDRLFEDLSTGRLGPDDAEQLARALGIPPLLSKLDPSRYDPMQEDYWTLAMAVAWIAWRDLDRVRDVLPSWRRDHEDWFFREYRVPDGKNGWTVRAGWVLERVHNGEAPFMFLSLCQAMEASEGLPVHARMRRTIRAAREDLWRELGKGKLSATTTAEGGGIIQIPAYEWAFLEHGETRDRDVLYVRGHRATLTGPSYSSDVLIPRERVLSLWPEHLPTSPVIESHELIRQAAKEIVKPGMRATMRNDAIRDAMKAKHLVPPSDTTIKEALKGTSYLRTRRRRQTRP